MFVRQELAREHLPEGRVIATPRHLGEGEIELRLLSLVAGGGAGEPAAAVSAGEDQVGHPGSGWRTAYATATAPPWDSPSSGNRSSPTESTTSSRSSTQASKPKSLDLPVGHAAAALVVADQPVSGRELVDPVRPDRAGPLDVQVGQPVGRLDQRRAVSGEGVGDAHVVGRQAVADLLRAADRWLRGVRSALRPVHLVPAPRTGSRRPCTVAITRCCVTARPPRPGAPP